MHTGNRYDTNTRHILIILVVGILLPILIGSLTVVTEAAIPMLVIAFCTMALVSTAILANPMMGIVFVLFGSFFFITLGREAQMNLGMLAEILLLLTWLAVLIAHRKQDSHYTYQDLNILLILWFIISVMEMFNPAANLRGAIGEFRSVALYPFLLTPLVLSTAKKIKHADLIIILVILFSVIAALNGIKQKHINLSPGDYRFLASGSAETHVIFGRLRVFSFYPDAGQFGASQAHIGLLAMILAFGPFKRWKRFLLLLAAILLFYGMLISGTRGSLFVVVAGAFVALVLSKNFKFVIGGLVALMLFIGFLKFTHIGNSNYDIYRLRTALDPADASLNVRLHSQQVLREYLSDKPFGDGLGTIGYFGSSFNEGTFLSTVQPDSYWVKIWAMYGIVGFTLWFAMMMYILGKCCGIVWRIRDKGLKIKMMALTSGYAGVLFCSYGNEVINNQPSAFIVYSSLALIFLSPKWDEDLAEKKALQQNPDRII